MSILKPCISILKIFKNYYLLYSSDFNVKENNRGEYI